MDMVGLFQKVYGRCTQEEFTEQMYRERKRMMTDPTQRSPIHSPMPSLQTLLVDHRERRNRMVGEVILDGEKRTVGEKTLWKHYESVIQCSVCCLSTKKIWFLLYSVRH